MRKIFTIFLFLICFSSFDTANAQTTNNKVKHNTAKKVDSKKKAQTNYEKIINTPHKTYSGLCTIHKFRSKIYFEIPLSLMGRDFLFASTISSSSDNTNAICGQKVKKPFLFQFKIENYNLLMVLPNNNIIRSDDSNIQKALNNSNLSPIFKSFKIITYDPEKKNAVIDATELFVSEIEEITPLDKKSKFANYGKSKLKSVIQKPESYVKEAKVFKNNISIKSVLSYKNVISNGPSSKTIPFITEVTRTILLLPEKPMMPRLADRRISVFNNGKTFFSPSINGSKKKYFARKWRLAPKDTTAWIKGQLSEPIKPIVFYIDDNYPDQWKEYIKLGVEDWQKAFEAIGFKNAIIAKSFPTKKEAPDFDPDNLKYSCLRYAPINIANSMGPSWIDPRSGEIINASVYSFHNISKLIRNWIFVQTSQCDKSVRKINLDKEKFGQVLRYVIAHEIGHCLGFKHNMSASSAMPTDSLRSPSFTKKYGTTYSIMDYARFNYVAQPGDMERGVKLTPPNIGLYDYYTVKWLYTPILDANTPEEEVPVLDSMINEKSGNPIYRYGRQQFYGKYDPSSQEEDLGDNAIKSSRFGIKNLKYIIKNFNEWVKDEDKDFSFRNEIYRNILIQYQRYIGHVAANIGGVYLNEVYEDDNLSRFSSVSRIKQRSSLNFLLGEINTNSWIEAKSLNKFVSFDVPIINTININIYKVLLNKIKTVKLASDISDSKNRYTEREYFYDIYEYTWRPLQQKTRLTEKKKICQILFIDFLIKQSGINNSNGGVNTDTFGITNALSASDNMESVNYEYCSLCNINSDINAFNYMLPLKLKKIIIPPSFYYEYLLKVKGLIELNLDKKDFSNKAHYKFILAKINRIIG